MIQRVSLILSLVLVLGVLGCGSGNESANSTLSDRRHAVPDSSGVTRGGRIVIGVQQEPEMLNEILHATATNNLVCNLLFSKFVKYDDNFNLIPDLLTEVPTVDNGGISSDHLTYTYHLRPDATWHDGQPVTSRDVRFTFDVIMNPKVNVESREGWDVVERVDTPDDHTVVFHLERPYPDFVGETFYDESVLPEHVLRGEVGARFHSARYHHAPVGSGPFRFKEWVSGSHLIVEANHDYYGEGPYLDRIIFKFIPSENTLLVQLKTGEIDLFDNANITFVDQIESIPGIKVYRTPLLMYEHIDLNTENEILNDRRVRQALALATNKKEIAELIYNGLVTVAPLDEYEASRYYHHAAAEKARFDPLRAKLLLKAAGWQDSDGDGIADRDGKALRLHIATSSGQPNRERTELVLREQYRKIGVDLLIRNYNPTVLYGTYVDRGILKRGKFDLAMYAWLSSPEPATKEALYSGKNLPPNGQNHPRINHPELTRLLAEGSTEVDPEKRRELYFRVAEILVEEVPVIPLFWYTSLDPCTDRLQNFRPNPTQSADTWNAATWYLQSPSKSSRAQ